MKFVGVSPPDIESADSVAVLFISFEKLVITFVLICMFTALFAGDVEMTYGASIFR